MATPRSGTSEETGELVERPPVAKPPELNLYKIHSKRTILTESGNTDGWIATDTTVTPRE